MELPIELDTNVDIMKIIVPIRITGRQPIVTVKYIENNRL